MKPNLTFIYDRKKVASKTKAGVVELRISDENVRKYISTGVKLLPKEWSNGSVVCRKDFKELNDQLQIIKKKASEIINKMMDEDCLDINAVPGILKGTLMQSETFIAYAEELAQRRYRNITKGTQDHYKLLFKFLNEWKGIVYFSDITERKIMKMDDELERRGLKECTRWNYHKLMKTFIIQAVEDGLVKRNPYSRLDIKKGNEEGLTRFLSPEEFHRLESCIIPIERLRKVRDLFVFQAASGLSYTDMAKLVQTDFQVTEDGQYYIHDKRNKTGVFYTAVILEQGVEILKKYHFKLPILGNHKMNVYLKTIRDLCGIDKPIFSHVARHTYATRCLNRGIRLEVVAKLLGHSTTRITQHYAKLLKNNIINEVKDAFEKSY
jgi:integrase